jgi:hypothetical protein
VSISPTRVLSEAFLYLQFRFELVLALEFWRKYALTMLVKLTTVGEKTKLAFDTKIAILETLLHMQSMQAFSGLSTPYQDCYKQPNHWITDSTSIIRRILVFSV